MSNILFIINYNSDSSVSNLIRHSSFESIDISKIVVVSNGLKPLQNTIHAWINTIKNSCVDLDSINICNLGYGAAINHCFSLLATVYADYDYCFFSNSDLTFVSSDNTYNFRSYDAVGFPMYDNGNFMISKISILTPFIPFRLRRYFSLKPKFGNSQVVHGCFFGIKVNTILNTGVRFYEDYFLYWEEMRFFYELDLLGINIGVSNTLKINHDGVKSIVLDDSRYYLLRNGLDFYKNMVRSSVLFYAWLMVNWLYAKLAPANGFLVTPDWYSQAINAFKMSSFGVRRPKK